MYSKPTTIRLSEDEKKEAKEKAQAYGLNTIAAVLRYALKQLPPTNANN